MTTPSYVRATRALLSRRALRKNWEAIRRRIPKESRILPMVKANGYGHGMFEIAQEFSKLSAVGVGVADLMEAILLRDRGFQGEILCLGNPSEDAFEEAHRHNILLSLFAEEHLAPMASFVRKKGKRLRVHIKVDTGMHRLGIDGAAWGSFSRLLAKEEGVSVEGIFTHLAESPNPDRTFTDGQLAAYEKAVGLFEAALGRRLIRHASNSGGILSYPRGHFDWVRPGLAAYGYPDPVPPAGETDFAPVLTWRAPIVQVKTIAAGDSVGYNRAFVAPGAMRIATAGVGYGDGFQRRFAPAGVGFRGVRCPVLGLVCMDLLTIDVSPFQGVRSGEEITLLGESESGAPDARELARAGGTMPYEVLTGLSHRVTRQWVEG